MSRQRPDHDTLFMPLNSKCQRITRLARGWRIWLSTADYKYGTFLELCDDGQVVRFVTRADEGDECIIVRPSDPETRASKMRGIGDVTTANGEQIWR
jgi:hypothetical protein